MEIEFTLLSKVTTMAGDAHQLAPRPEAHQLQQ
jgi:hypothetical protein